VKIELSKSRTADLDFNGLHGLTAGCCIFQKNFHTNEWEPAIVLGCVGSDESKSIITITPDGSYEYSDNQEVLHRLIRIYANSEKPQEDFTPEIFKSLYYEFLEKIEAQGKFGILKMLNVCWKVNFEQRHN